MKLVILSVGKSHDDTSSALISYYQVKILRYAPVEWLFIPHDVTKEKEGIKILERIKKEDYVVLLDEKGRDMKSEAFAELVENRMVDSVRRIVFIIGGAYGVTKAVIARSDIIWSLGKLVFPHQLVRVIVAERLYRAYSIHAGHPYHHE